MRFRPIDSKTIRYGLGALKGTGEAALTVILKAREADGPFTDLFDFCRRLDKRVVNRRVIESLIRAGAFDSIDNHRASGERHGTRKKVRGRCGRYVGGGEGRRIDLCCGRINSWVRCSGPMWDGTGFIQRE